MSQIRTNDARLQSYGLHSTHVWWKFDGDCWEGKHSEMWCEECEIIPFLEDPCYHELPWHNLPSNRYTVNPFALRPCSVVD